MKVRILSTGNVEEYDGSYAQRLVDMGYAVTVKDGEPKEKVKVEVVDKVPEPEPEAPEEEPAGEEPVKKPAKGKKK